MLTHANMQTHARVPKAQNYLLALRSPTPALWGPSEALGLGPICTVLSGWSGQGLAWWLVCGLLCKPHLVALSSLVLIAVTCIVLPCVFPTSYPPPPPPRSPASSSAPCHPPGLLGPSPPPETAPGPENDHQQRRGRGGRRRAAIRRPSVPQP